MSFLRKIRERLEANPARVVIAEVQEAGIREFCAHEILQEIGRFRSCLEARGVGRGDRVALLAANSARWVAADLAIMEHGAATVPLYTRQKPQELAVILRDAQPKLLLAGSDELAEAMRQVGFPQEQIVQFAEVSELQPSGEPAFDPPPEHIVTIVYTSGTSGDPKGVMLNRANIDYMVEITTRRTEEITKRPSGSDRVFHFLPLCFAGSRMMVWTQLYRGNPFTFSTNLERLQEELRQVDPNFYLNVPLVLERVRRAVNEKLENRGGLFKRLYDAAFHAYLAQQNGQRTSFGERLSLAVARRLLFPKIREGIGRSLEFLICGSAPLSPETQHWFHMLGIPVYQVYGLTETTAIVSIDELGKNRPSYVGFPIPGCQVKLTEQGELICRGPNIFPGYWRRPDETARVIRDGWFYTGDQAEFGPEGQLKILGRVKYVIVLASGHNVPPEPIEQRLQELEPRIQHAVVVGHGRPFLSAIVTGQVDEASIQQAIEKLNEELPHYKKIRKFFIASEPFTIENGLLTANGKLRRDLIERRYREEIERLYQ